MKVAASPQSINRAMPEGGIQVTSHQSLVTPNPQSLIPSYSSLLSNFRVQGCGGSFAAIYMGRCPNVVFKSPVTSHLRLLIPNP